MIRYAISSRFNYLVCIVLVFAMRPTPACAGGPDIDVELDVSKARPRAVENQTERRIVADYRLAWVNIAQALDSNSMGPLDGLFVGPAKESLTQTVSSQQHSRISTRYLNQNHELQAIFYSPEGDVIELHDTAEYRTQVLSSGNLIHDQQGVHHYIVLMTPAADRWVIRQLLEVSQF